MSKPMRDAMPKVSEFVDACRGVFGVSTINNAIRDGIDGLPTFYASEAGESIGTPAPKAAFSVSGDALVQEPMVARKGRAG
mgnify:CR=1 FL=1